MQTACFLNVFSCFKSSKPLTCCNMIKDDRLCSTSSKSHAHSFKKLDSNKDHNSTLDKVIVDHQIRLIKITEFVKMYIILLSLYTFLHPLLLSFKHIVIRIYACTWTHPPHKPSLTQCTLIISEMDYDKDKGFPVNFCSLISGPATFLLQRYAYFLSLAGLPSPTNYMVRYPSWAQLGQLESMPNNNNKKKY